MSHGPLQLFVRQRCDLTSSVALGGRAVTNWITYGVAPDLGFACMSLSSNTEPKGSSRKYNSPPRRLAPRQNYLIQAQPYLTFLHCQLVKDRCGHRLDVIAISIASSRPSSRADK